MVNVTGSDNIGGVNQSADNDFSDAKFWFEWIELAGTSTSNLSDAGFDISNGDLGPSQTVYNAGGFDEVNLPSQTGQFGNSADDFAIRLSTTLTVQAGGNYTFNVGSDDGSRLYVNGQQVVENDGLQAFAFDNGSINLAAGQHEIVILFFERGGEQQLQTTIAGPDTGGTAIDLADANVQANAGSDNVQSGEGADTVIGGAGDDTIDAGDGADTVDAGFGDDSVTGGGGGDTLDGGAGSDTIDGGAGDDLIRGDGDDDSLQLNRESFEWDLLPDPDNGGQIDDGDNIETAPAQNTGTISVQTSFTSLSGNTDFAFDTFAGNTAGIDSGGEPVATNSNGQIFANGGAGTGRASLVFTSSDPATEDEVRNISFRINDIDTGGGGAFPDSVTVRAFDADDNPVVVTLTAGGNLTLSDTDAVSGADTATQTAGASGAGTVAGNSLLVEIAGPVARLEIDYTGNSGNAGGVRITDVYFDAVVDPNSAARDDSLTGGAGSDTIEGGAGADTIEGSEDDDTLLGGEGDDSITDFDGDNSLDGGAGDDFLQVGASTSNQVLVGGTGNDTINAFLGDNSTTDVSGGDGDDSITVFNGPNSTNTIDGGAGDDSLQAGDSRDTITGGTGEDTLDGGANDDSLDGGADDDTLRGFTGDDLLDGGAGSDALSGGDGFDTFIVSSGDDTISDFNTGTGQDFDDDNQANNDFLNLAPYYDDLAEMRRDLGDDGLLNQSVAEDDYTNNTALPGTISLGGTAGEDLTFDNVNLVCFTPGVLIETPRGARPVERLTVGDLVETLDHGYRPVRWVGRKTVGSEVLAQAPRLRPIRIRAGALGCGLPRATLVVSPQHRLLISSKIVRRMFGLDEVLVPAKSLIGLPGIERDNSCEAVTYLHVLLDEHEVLIANGAPAESLFNGPMALQSLDAVALREIGELFPEVLESDRAQTLARLVPQGREQRTLAARHGKNPRGLLESFAMDRLVEPMHAHSRQHRISAD